MTAHTLCDKPADIGYEGFETPSVSMFATESTNVEPAFETRKSFEGAVPSTEFREAIRSGVQSIRPQIATRRLQAIVSGESANGSIGARSIWLQFGRPTSALRIVVSTKRRHLTA